MSGIICAPTYVPVGPYFFKRSKDPERKKKSLEELMFEEYSWLCNELKMMDSNLREGSRLNEMHEHLRWLLEQGETRRSELLCPYCGKNKIKLFSYSFKERKYFISCDSSDTFSFCKYHLLPMAQRHSLKFSSILNFNPPSQPYVGTFLKTVFFPGKERLNAEELFKFFAAQSPA